MLQKARWIKIGTESKMSPYPRSAHTAIIHNNKLIIFAGRTDDGDMLNDLHSFDFELGQWSRVSINGKLKPTCRAFHSTVIYKSRMYTYGGNYGNSMFAFSFNDSCWEEIPMKGDFPSKVSNLIHNNSHHACVVHQDKMYLFGWKQAWEFDFLTLSWTKLKSAEYGYYSNDIRDYAFSYRGFAYIIHYVEKDLEMTKFDFNTCKFEPIQFKKQGIKFDSNYVVELINNKLFCLSSGQLYSHTFGTDNWNKIEIDPKFEVPLIYNSSLSVHNNRLVLFGGELSTRQYIKDLYELHFGSNLKEDLSQILKSGELFDIEFMDAAGIPHKAHKALVQLRLGSEQEITKFSNLCLHENSIVVTNCLHYIYGCPYEFDMDSFSTNEQTKQMDKIDAAKSTQQLFMQLSRGKHIFEKNEIEKDFLEFQKDNESKDFVIIVKDEDENDVNIRAHKFVLALRSGLYRNMLVSVQDESNTVPDFTGKRPKSIQALVDYFYTDKISHIQNFAKKGDLTVAMELLNAPDFYELTTNDLTFDCLSILKRNLNSDNWFPLLEYIFGERLFEDLEQFIVNFVFYSKFKEKIKRSKMYQKLIKTDWFPMLAKMYRLKV
ncbi:leucine-zipper-like transcriptional regulator 1 [Anaeramoeba ignava]|uniref:Leucine-zipper-like transcriptional regulator 1 n=1 Tax=Anaeramoeba ignava TaxID=1746090 RepID=A0A9Q0RHJ0_ANAIG|nr:leucine-zipper-like transcriptional regulator 1 [Anaeramoeba ignava]